MHSNLIENYKKDLKLTKEQRAIIIGTLLGDGHLEASDKLRTYRLKIEHSIKEKEYVDWLYQKLKPWTNGLPKTRKVNSIFPNGKILESIKYGFTTYSHGKLRYYGQQFYSKDKKKVVPKIISKLLNPLAIAIWYLDDGSWKSARHKTFIIHTHAFSKQELKNLQRALENFKIKTRLHRQNREEKTYWRMYVLSESAAEFRKLIIPIVNQMPSMEYKLGNTLPKE